MKTYYIYYYQDDTFLGTVQANSIEEAEYIAAGLFTEYGSIDLYALSYLI